MERKEQNQLTAVSEIQVSYLPKVKASDRPKINSSRKAYELLRQQWNAELIEYVEEFKVLLLNRANRVLGII
jgi:DNA repair protein RadC